MIPQAFLKRVEIRAGCWIWRGQWIDGAPRFLDGRRSRRADVVAFEAFYRVRARRLVALCGRADCVNPAHLERQTLDQAVLEDRRARERTHCAQGHPWGPGSWRWVSGARPGRRKRRCILCMQNERLARQLRRSQLFGRAQSGG